MKYATFMISFWSLMHQYNHLKPTVNTMASKPCEADTFQQRRFTPSFLPPFYTFATPEVWDYYKSRGCIMTDKRERWDGKTGIVIYGRTTERKGKHSKQPPNKWRVSVGRHIPFIPAEIWLATSIAIHTQ